MASISVYKVFYSSPLEGDQPKPYKGIEIFQNKDDAIEMAKRLEERYRVHVEEGLASLSSISAHSFDKSAEDWIYKSESL